MGRSLSVRGGLTLQVAMPAWFDDAACKRPGTPDVFFREKSPVDVARARAICLGCPIVNRCKSWAVQTRQDHGIWGGTTPDDRRRLIRAIIRGN